jgi:hypothetical protein
MTADWWNRSPRLSGRELVLVALTAALVAVIQFWPLILNLGSVIPLDLGDPLPQAWQIAWDGHALLTQPLSFFQSNQFWPLNDTLAFSDALIGYTPAGMIGSGPEAAVARYDLLFLFAFALCFFGAYLLARELGAPPWAALVAGAAFAYAPWRLEQGGHLHVISSGGIPIALALLLRGYRRQSGGLILGGWAVAAWQLSLGFSLGLPLVYLLALLALIAAVIWWRAGRPAPTRRVVITTLAGGALLAVVGFVLSRPYLRVLDAYPESERSANLISYYSPPLKAFLAAPETSLIWGSVTAPVRAGIDAVAEKTLFPGLAILLLALSGLGWRGYPKTLRIGLGLAALATAILSLGFAAEGVGSWLPYRWLFEVLPGWQGIRVPGRLQTITSLLLALLAAGGAARIAAALADRSKNELWAGASPALLTLLVLIEGSGLVYPHPRVPAAPASLAGLRQPLLQLPAEAPDNRRYLLWSTDGFPKMLNGRTGFQPRYFAATLSAADGLSTVQSLENLRSRGVATIVINEQLPGGRKLAASAQRLLPVSGVASERRGPLLILRLPPIGAKPLGPPR